MHRYEGGQQGNAKKLADTYESLNTNKAEYFFFEMKSIRRNEIEFFYVLNPLLI